MKKTAIVLMLITIISKFFGFVREITLSFFYGASDISDVYLISQTIPMVIFSFIGTGLYTGYIPMYTRINREFGEEEGNRFTNNLVNLLIVICTIIVIFGLFFTEGIVRIFASGFDGKTFSLAVQFTRIGLVGIYFIGLKDIFSGFLQVNGNYVIPALVGIPMSIVVILSIFISYKTHILILAIGSVIAIISQLLILIPFIHKQGYRYKLVLKLKDKYIKEMLHIVLPVIIGVSVNQINILIDKTLASSIAVGGISALNYANILNGFAQGMFITPIVTVIYPMISKIVSKKDLSGVKKLASEAINSANLLIVPATIGAMIFAEEIVSLIFGRGAFDGQAISMTTSALYFYSIGMIGFGHRDILSKVFYSLQDTKTPMMNAVLGMILNIILNIILSKYMGIGGLALATSISSIITTILLFVSLRKKLGFLGMKQVSISFVKILLASLVMGLISKLCFKYLLFMTSNNISLLIAIGIGAISYFVIIYFMKIEDVDVIVGAIKKKLGRRTTY